MVIGGVVGEDGGAVEGAVGLGEVEPAFVAYPFGTLTTDADPDYVGGGVEEVFAEGDEGFVAHFLDEGIDGHGVDKFLVVDSIAIFESHDFRVCINFPNISICTKSRLLFRECVSYRYPDGSSPTVSRETEGGIRSPIAGGLLQNDVLRDIFEVWCCNALAQPLALHLHRSAFSLLMRPLEQTAVVGTAQTLKLYGLMKRSAIPVPIMRTIHSSKFFGFVLATRASSAASIIPSMQLTCSCFGNMDMLFWKG